MLGSTIKIVDVCVYVGFVMCGCFDSSVGVFICVLVFIILYCLYCVFVLFRLCIFVLICFVCTSVKIKWDVGVWTGLGWFRIETGGGHL
jgi:hypothetical protein